MRRPRTASIALTSLILSATVASAGALDARYRDPQGDYRGPKVIVHPDIISLVVTNTASSLQFDINFVRAPGELDDVEVLLDLDPHRAKGLGKGRFRQADLTFSESEVWRAYSERARIRVLAYIASVSGSGPVGWLRASGRSVHMTVPSRFVIRDDKGRKHTVVIPGRFRFFVWAWASEHPDRDLPDEDYAPNSGWFTYRMS
jgi:hypothetical protein